MANNYTTVVNQLTALTNARINIINALNNKLGLSINKNTKYDKLPVEIENYKKFDPKIDHVLVSNRKKFNEEQKLDQGTYTKRYILTNSAIVYVVVSAGNMSSASCTITRKKDGESKVLYKLDVSYQNNAVGVYTTALTGDIIEISAGGTSDWWADATAIIIYY